MRLLCLLSHRSHRSLCDSPVPKYDSVSLLQCKFMRSINIIRPPHENLTLFQKYKGGYIFFMYIVFKGLGSIK